MTRGHHSPRRCIKTWKLDQMVSRIGPGFLMKLHCKTVSVMVGELFPSVVAAGFRGNVVLVKLHCKPVTLSDQQLESK